MASWIYFARESLATINTFGEEERSSCLLCFPICRSGDTTICVCQVSPVKDFGSQVLHVRVHVNCKLSLLNTDFKKDMCVLMQKCEFLPPCTGCFKGEGGIMFVCKLLAAPLTPNAWSCIFQALKPAWVILKELLLCFIVPNGNELHVSLIFFWWSKGKICLRWLKC